MFNRFSPVSFGSIALGAAAVTMLFAPDIALAQDLAATAGRLDTQIDALGQLFLQIMFFGGLVLFGIGIFLIYKDSKQQNQGHAKNGIIGILNW